MWVFLQRKLSRRLQANIPFSLHTSIEKRGTIYLRARVYGRSTLSPASLVLGGPRRSDISRRDECIRARAAAEHNVCVTNVSDAVNWSTHRIRYGELTALIAVVN